MTLTRRDDYDAAGRRVRQRHLAIEAADRTLETGYWPNGAVKRQRMADGTWTGLYGYDGFGRLASLDNAVPASAAEPDFFVTAIAYNARGQTETIAYGNGMTATYSYSLQRGWLDRVVVQKAAATLLDQTYSRTPDVPAFAYTLPVLGTLALALAVLLQKRSAIGAMPVYQSLCIQCLSVSAVFGLFAWREVGVLPVLDHSFIDGILWLILVATFGAWGLYITSRFENPLRHASPPYFT